LRNPSHIHRVHPSDVFGEPRTPLADEEARLVAQLGINPGGELSLSEDELDAIAYSRAQLGDGGHDQGALNRDGSYIVMINQSTMTKTVQDLMFQSGDLDAVLWSSKNLAVSKSDNGYIVEMDMIGAGRERVTCGANTLRALFDAASSLGQKHPQFRPVAANINRVLGTKTVQ
jgi:hypothetical protein